MAVLSIKWLDRYLCTHGCITYTPGSPIARVFPPLVPVDEPQRHRHLTFAMCTGLIRGTLSVLMRYQLMRPGNEPGKGVHGYLVCHHGTIRPAEAPTWAGEDWINRQFDTVDAQLWNLGSMSAS